MEENATFFKCCYCDSILFAAHVSFKINNAHTRSPTWLFSVFLPFLCKQMQKQCVCVHLEAENTYFKRPQLQSSIAASGQTALNSNAQREKQLPLHCLQPPSCGPAQAPVTASFILLNPYGPHGLRGGHPPPPPALTITSSCSPFLFSFYTHPYEIAGLAPRRLNSSLQQSHLIEQDLG